MFILVLDYGWIEASFHKTREEAEDKLKEAQDIMFKHHDGREADAYITEVLTKTTFPF